MGIVLGIRRPAPFAISHTGVHAICGKTALALRFLDASSQMSMGFTTLGGNASRE
jgi:hypothetical protein